MENKKSGWIIAVVVIALLSLIGSCSNGGNSSGGRCKYCGRETNWTYRGGGYICYVCDHQKQICMYCVLGNNYEMPYKNKLCLNTKHTFRGEENESSNKMSYV